jgi:ABC-type nitrate/sulfonate/bicarbonate transport system substrate-binding protein
MTARSIRLRVLGLVGVVVFTGAACGQETTSGGDGSEGVTTIELAGIPPFSIPIWPMIVADHQGFYDRESVDVNITFTFDGGQLLAGGQVDVLSDGADSGLIAASQGKDILFVAPHMDTVTDGLMVSRDITAVADLEGATLRSAGFGTDEFLARRFIEENGVNPENVTFVPIEDDGAALAQLESGEIDGGMFGVGALLEAEQTGDFNVLGPPEALGTYPWNTIQTTRTFAEANEDALVGFIRATQDGILFMQDSTNRDAVIEAVLATGEGLPPEDVELSYDSAEGFGQYSLEPLTPDDLEPAFDFFEFAGEDIDVGSLNLAELIDNSYLESAVA